MLMSGYDQIKLQYTVDGGTQIKLYVISSQRIFVLYRILFVSI